MIPVAHWGTQDILPYGSKKAKLCPRKTVRTVAGPPVDLSQWAGKATSAKALRAATAAIMADVTALVASLRGEEPPAVPTYDPGQKSADSGRQVRRAQATEPELTDVKAAVLGAGSWGTTFAQVLCDAGTPVTLWARRADIADAINDLHENPRYLPGISLPPR